jgi:hypothetical protein
MRMKLLAAAVIVGGIVAVWKIIEERPAKPNLENIATFISYACDAAVADAKKFDGVNLDYSVGSIKSVDTILGRMHDSYVRNPGSVHLNGISIEYGAYVGEVIRRSEPNAYWTKDSELGEKIYPLHWGADEAFPIAWCSKRIINGDEDSIWFKYTALKEGLAKPTNKANTPNSGKPH